MGDVNVYASSIFSCSVCAPKTMPIEAVIAEVEELDRGYLGDPKHVTGWQLSKDAIFSGGQPNPCPCENDGERQHWLLDAG